MGNKRVCFFLHYYPGATLPLYVKYYVNELINHFDEVRLITNTRKIDLKPGELKENIQIQFEKNEGYDYGLFYKGFQQLDINNYSQIACINDSNVLLNRLNPIFEREKFREVDFWGLVDSNEKPWFSKHPENYHIQSHFIVFNEKAVALLPEFFKSSRPEQLFPEKDPKQLRRKVINDWELGVSQFLLSKGLSHATYMNSKKLLKKYHPRSSNVTHSLYRELLDEGYPLLKKRVLLQKKWNLFYRKRKIRNLVSHYSNTDWNLDGALEELFR